MKLAYSLCLTVSVLTLAVNNCAVASPLDNSHTYTHNTLLELKPISSLEYSYNLAAAVFLPDFEDGLDFSSHKNNENISTRENCSGYPLSSCPAQGICESCIFDRTKKKLTACTSPYFLSGSSCICPTAVALVNSNDTCTQYCDNQCIKKTCSKSANQTGCTNATEVCDDGCGGLRQCCIPCRNKITSKPNNSSYTYSSCTDGDGQQQIQSGWKCLSGYHQQGNACEKDCIANKCSGYDLTSCPAKGVCSQCTVTAVNCTSNGTKYKLDGCKTGYTVSDNSCIYAKITMPILYSDKTTAYQIISGKTPIGVVFDTNRRLALSLDEIENTMWMGAYLSNPIFSNYFTSASQARSDTNGQQNTLRLHSECARYDCYPIDFAYSYSTVGTKAGDWYLPAAGEWLALKNTADGVNDTLQALGKPILQTWRYLASSSPRGTWGYSYCINDDEVASFSDVYVRAAIKY